MSMYTVHGAHSAPPMVLPGEAGRDMAVAATVRLGEAGRETPAAAACVGIAWTWPANVVVMATGGATSTFT